MGSQRVGHIDWTTTTTNTQRPIKSYLWESQALGELCLPHTSAKLGLWNKGAFGLKEWVLRWSFLKRATEKCHFSILAQVTLPLCPHLGLPMWPKSCNTADPAGPGCTSSSPLALLTTQSTPSLPLSRFLSKYHLIALVEIVLPCPSLLLLLKSNRDRDQTWTFSKGSHKQSLV